MREHIIENFNIGLITDIEAKSIPKNAASSSLNWLTKGDRIELSGGYNIVGDENSGVGKITGLGTGETVGGADVTYRTRDQRLEYYDASTETWTENGTNLLTSAANGEDISISHYTSAAGYYTYISSPNSGLFKINNSFPAANKDVYVSGTNYKGYLKATDTRMYMWNTSETFKNILNGSHKDTQDEYTSTTGENIGTGDGILVTFAGTLSNITGVRTAHAVVATDTVETFTDNRDGTLTGSAGGTGTINYLTGAISVTFNTAPTNLQAITADYDYEDSNATGITNFGATTPRVANEGFFLPQATGGDILNIFLYNQELYAMHKTNTWLFTISVDDLDISNLVYRELTGMPNWRAGVATGNGIYFIDTSNPKEIRFKKIRVSVQNNRIEPEITSFKLDLSGYNFDDGVVEEWGDFILFSGRTNGSSLNNRTFVLNEKYNSWDVLDYYVSCYTKNGGELWAGDSASDNVMRLFNGYSSNGSILNNHWEGGLTQLEIDEIKKFKRLTINGQIQTGQSCKVYLSYDGGGFNEVGEIDSAGSYVDKSAAVTVGSQVVGSSEVGGGSITSVVQAYNYTREFRVRSERFDRVKIRFVAQEAGYLSVSRIGYYDIKKYGQKNLKRYRQVIT